MDNLAILNPMVQTYCKLELQYKSYTRASSVYFNILTSCLVTCETRIL
jgi:hypothetical protein